ncbi:hypothetical protein QCA50_001343 [Cerrena zonata]|uniref:Uncharacterized protein n=1 Tax=Cerrena zonata TaxID=2478898 RepID=A0AAW0GLD3_9APHY
MSSGNASRMQHAYETRWTTLPQLRFEQIVEHQWNSLQCLGVLMEFLMRDENANTRECLEVVYRVRLCFESSMLWEQLDRLLEWARSRWPILSRALTPSPNLNTIPSVSDILHDPVYIHACHLEVLQAGGQIQEVDAEEGFEEEELPNLVMPEFLESDSEDGSDLLVDA